MGSVEKISQSNVYNIIRHDERLNQNYSNADIDLSRKNLDYVISPNRGMSNYDYYKQRLNECYLYNREDVKTIFSWVITCPEDVTKEDEDLFFYNVYDFLCERYGEENCVSATVHKDESGRPHMHFLSIPVVEDKKHEQGEKVCMNDVINRKELRNFHPDLDKFLKNRGMNCAVYTGITRKNGGNMTVKQLKAEREMKQEVQQKRERKWEHVV